MVPSIGAIPDAGQRLLRFCEEEYAYYDAIRSANPDQIEPIDVLVTVAMNSSVRSATRIRAIHRGIAARCEPVLSRIPQDANLLAFDPNHVPVQELLHEAVQVPGVLVPVATKILHRKRPNLIPMLDNVLLWHYLQVRGEEVRWPATQDKRHAASLASEVLGSFRDDLQSCEGELTQVVEGMKRQGYSLSLV